MRNSRVIIRFRSCWRWAGWVSLFWIANVGFLGLVEGQHRSPRITEHPKDVLVKRNEPTTLNCKAEGKPEPTIEWYKDGILQNQSNDGHRIFLPGGDLFFLSVSDGKKESDSGIYWCIARNSIGVVQSRNASLQVGVIRDEFRVLPQNTKALVGETATLKCQPPKGTPEPQVLWQKSGQSIDTRLATGRLQNADGGNLIIKNVQVEDAGRFQCISINIAGTRVAPEVTLTVHQKPYFKSEPKDVTVLIGDSAIFNCDVDGMPTPSVDWYRQDTQMPKDRAERVGNGLKIKDARQEDEGLYFCQVQNVIGSVRASALLRVQSKPKFMTRPKNLLRIGLGDKIKFECSASGNPTPTTYWRKGGTQELFLRGGNYLEGNLHVSLDGTLVIENVKNNDIGFYICSSMNPAGSIEAIAKLELASSVQRLPPIISLGPTNQTLPIKSVALFPCEVIGVPSPAVKWFKDGIDLTKDVANSGDRITISANGTLQINDLRANDSGLYTCVGSDRGQQQQPFSIGDETSRTGALWVESPTNPNIAFKRTDPSLLPQPPSAPVVNETSSTTITLSWTWSATTKQMPFRSQPLLGFTLEAYSPDLRLGWMVLGRRIYGGGSKTGEVFHTVEGLKPDTRYMFLVRAETQEGFSPVSNISKIIKTRGVFRGGSELEEEFDEEELRNQLASSEIGLINCEPTSSTSIRISWKISKSVIRFIDGYYLRYREISSGNSEHGPSLAVSDHLLLTTEPQQQQQQKQSSSASMSQQFQPKGFKVLTVVAQKTDAYSHTISNLEKFTQYEVFIAPFYKSVEGLISNSKMVITSEDKPSAPPQILSSRMMNSSAAAVRWSAPPQIYHNGVLTGYKVEVRGNESHAEMSFGPNITSIVLSNLTLGKSYFVRVTAFTAVGIGPWSSPLKITMDPLSLNNINSADSISAEDSPSEILKEVWFIILMGILLFIFLLLLVVILYTRRKSHGKKDHISSASVGPNTASQYVSGKQTLWIDQDRWRQNDPSSDKDSSRSESKLLTNHVNGDLTEATDYAEVDPHNLTTFYGGPLLQQPDLTPYATTTLIQRRPAYDLLPMNGGVYVGKNLADKYREADQFSSGRSKFSTASNFRFKSTQPSPSPSPLGPMKRLPMTSRLPSCYPSPDPNRSHLYPLEQPILQQQPYMSSSSSSSRLPSSNRANENLYHIGEIFNPNKSSAALIANGFSEVVYQSGDPEFNNYHHNSQLTQLCPMMDREIQSSLPSLASDSTSCNLYAECNNDDNNLMLNRSKTSNSNNGNYNNGGLRHCTTSTKHSRCTSPAYSSDSFNSGKSGGTTNNKRYNKNYNSNNKPMDRRQLAPLFST